ncbi:MAG: hypothetical protein HC908_08420 [Calothrix sp. SM1_7_51]|nr:hypothetical protein [Calothrix sp. SM1_7_51]
MGKLVVLKLMENNVDQGFQVILQISSDFGRITTEMKGYLPPVPEIFEHHQSWQLAYRGLDASLNKSQRIKLKADKNKCFDWWNG